MTAHELIQALGGTASVAKLLGIGPSAVSNWKAAGRIPPRWYLRLAPEAHRLNVPLDAGVFGEDGRAA